jgi:hypothetical protein
MTVEGSIVGDEAFRRMIREELAEQEFPGVPSSAWRSPCRPVDLRETGGRG